MEDRYRCFYLIEDRMEMTTLTSDELMAFKYKIILLTDMCGEVLYDYRNRA